MLRSHETLPKLDGTASAQAPARYQVVLSLLHSTKSSNNIQPEVNGWSAFGTQRISLNVSKLVVFSTTEYAVVLLF